MKWLKNRLLWCLLLNKRLLKKYIFSALLCVIPVLVFVMREVAKQENSMLKVALYAQEPQDGMSRDIIENLLQMQGIVNYYSCDSKEELIREIETDRADCGYLFPADMQKYLQMYVRGEVLKLPYERHLIMVAVKEDSIWTQLAREQLYGVLYPKLAYEVLNQFTAGQEKFSGVSEEEREESLRKKFLDNCVADNIFGFAYLDSKEVQPDGESVNYLTAPLRGFLAIFMMLCGLAAALFLLQDKREGTFQWMPVGRIPFFEYLYLLVAVADAGLAVYAALFLSGTFTEWKCELAMIFLYIFAVTGFCNLVRQICGNIPRLGACIPVILLASFVLCPVFISTKKFGSLQWVFPPYFYLNSVHSKRMLEKLAWYSILSGMAGIFMQRLRIKIRK